jgi:micrococcal nuclease
MMLPAPVAGLAIVLVFSSPCLAKSSTFSGKVVGVADGDTITVMRDHQSVKIRLDGIDCPEKRQAFGKRAKQFTSKFVFGKTVTVKVVTRDKYRRMVGEVLLDGRSLNQALVRVGLAWWYRRYARKNKTLAALEVEARKSKRGLWVDPSPTPPWIFRHQGKALPDKRKLEMPQLSRAGGRGSLRSPLRIGADWLGYRVRVSTPTHQCR